MTLRTENSTKEWNSMKTKLEEASEAEEATFLLFDRMSFDFLFKQFGYNVTRYLQIVFFVCSWKPAYLKFWKFIRRERQNALQRTARERKATHQRSRLAFRTRSSGIWLGAAFARKDVAMLVSFSCLKKDKLTPEKLKFLRSSLKVANLLMSILMAGASLSNSAIAHATRKSVSGSRVET